VDLYENARQAAAMLAGRQAVMTTADLTGAGVTRQALTWRTAQGYLLRPHNGVYLAGRPDLVDLARAAMLVCPPGTVLGYHTAASLLGFGLIPSESIHVIAGPGVPVPQRRGITVHQTVVPIGEPVDVLGLPCAPAARCAVDLARALRRSDALPVLDAALHAGACDADALAGELKLHDGLRGVRQARELVPLADPRAQCRQESQLRLILYDGGLAGFVPQWPVVDDHGCTKYYLDLANPALGVGAEYDGSSHLDRARLRIDRARHNWLEGRGWRVRYFTDVDLYSRPYAIVPTLLRAAQPRRGSRGNSRE
jgi:very-short-patch-repair endonuclease